MIQIKDEDLKQAVEKAVLVLSHNAKTTELIDNIHKELTHLFNKNNIEVLIKKNEVKHIVIEQKEIQKKGNPPLSPEHMCFDKGHAMFPMFTFHGHQSSWGQHKCSRCGYEEDWQYDFIHGNPMYNQQQ